VAYEINNNDELVFEIKPNTSGHFAKAGRETAYYLIEITLTDDDEWEPLSNTYRFWINLYKENEFIPEEEEELVDDEEETDDENDAVDPNDDSWIPPDDYEVDWEEVDDEGYLVNWNPHDLEDEYQVVDLREDKPVNPEAPIPRIVSLD